MNEWYRYHAKSRNNFSHTQLARIPLNRLVPRIINLFAVPTLRVPMVRRPLPRAIATKERPPIVSTRLLRLIWSTCLSVLHLDLWVLSRLEPSLRSLNGEISQLLCFLIRESPHGAKSPALNRRVSTAYSFFRIVPGFCCFVIMSRSLFALAFLERLWRLW